MLNNLLSILGYGLLIIAAIAFLVFYLRWLRKHPIIGITGGFILAAIVLSILNYEYDRDYNLWDLVFHNKETTAKMQEDNGKETKSEKKEKEEQKKADEEDYSNPDLYYTGKYVEKNYSLEQLNRNLEEEISDEEFTEYIFNKDTKYTNDDGSTITYGELFCNNKYSEYETRDNKIRMTIHLQDDSGRTIGFQFKFDTVESAYIDNMTYDGDTCKDMKTINSVLDGLYQDYMECN